jgi:hypothetical protein
MAAMKLELARVHHATGPLPAEELVEIAGQALLDGWDSPSLRVLAGLVGVELDRARPRFEQALTELGLGVATHERGWRLLAVHTAQQLLNGEIPPPRALEALGRTAWEELGHPDQLSVFARLWSEWDYEDDWASYKGLDWSSTRHGLETRLRAAAEQFLAGKDFFTADGAPCP